MAVSYGLEEDRSLGRVLSATRGADGCAKVVVALDDSDEEEPSDNEPRSPSVEAVAVAAPLPAVVDDDEEQEAAKQNAVSTRKTSSKAAAVPDISSALAIPAHGVQEQPKKSKKKKKRKGRSRSRSRQRGSADSSGSSDDEDKAGMPMLPMLARPPGDVMSTAGASMVTGGTGLGPGAIATELTGIRGQVCMKFLQQECPLGDLCQFSHPRDVGEVSRWVQYFNKTPCKWGNMCKSTKCMYDHPNRPGWTGGSNAMMGASL